jgi:hypothetical protein
LDRVPIEPMMLVEARILRGDYRVLEIGRDLTERNDFVAFVIRISDAELAEEVTLIGEHIATKPPPWSALTSDWAGHHSPAACTCAVNELLPSTAKAKD